MSVLLVIWWRAVSCWGGHCLGGIGRRTCERSGLYWAFSAGDGIKKIFLLGNFLIMHRFSGRKFPHAWLLLYRTMRKDPISTYKSFLELWNFSDYHKDRTNSWKSASSWQNNEGHTKYKRQWDFKYFRWLMRSLQLISVYHLVLVLTRPKSSFRFLHES